MEGFIKLTPAAPGTVILLSLGKIVSIADNGAGSTISMSNGRTIQVCETVNIIESRLAMTFAAARGKQP
jgi:hypothetical protein